VKVEALTLPAAPRAPELERFELIVRDVLEDRAEGDEAGARLTSGLGIGWPGGPHGMAAHSARLREVLLA
jgi:hypothetical protein